MWPTRPSRGFPDAIHSSVDSLRSIYPSHTPGVIGRRDRSVDDAGCSTGAGEPVGPLENDRSPMPVRSATLVHATQILGRDCFGSLASSQDSRLLLEGHGRTRQVGLAITWAGLSWEYQAQPTPLGVHLRILEVTQALGFPRQFGLDLNLMTPTVAHGWKGTGDNKERWLTQHRSRTPCPLACPSKGCYREDLIPRPPRYI